MTVKADDPYEPWNDLEVSVEGNLGSFHYQVREGSGDYYFGKYVIFNGEGALDLTYNAVCTALNVENLDNFFDFFVNDGCWGGNNIVVGDGITSVTLETANENTGTLFVYLSSTVESLISIGHTSRQRGD